MKKNAVVIGAGIVGLATARALGAMGFHVDLFERNYGAIGASIRNFGMVWPIGQPTGKMYQRALRSRAIWKSLSEAGVFWHDPIGSLHIATENDEKEVLEELAVLFGKERNCKFVKGEEVSNYSPVAKTKGCKGGLFSPDEIIVNPREVLATLPSYLEETYGTVFHWGKCITHITNQTVYTGKSKIKEADLIFICSGADFETLYPDLFSQLPLTKCKLQMMRTVPQPHNHRIGPSLCGGLSLIHYKSFQESPSLPKLVARLNHEFPEYIQWGIHVMVSQNQIGELTIGDSHEYGPTHDPFDRSLINNLILNYLNKFTALKDYTIAETWNGVYSKSTEGATELFVSPEPGIYIINALGGAGMTLSFGLAEELVKSI